MRWYNQLIVLRHINNLIKESTFNEFKFVLNYHISHERLSEGVSFGSWF